MTPQRMVVKYIMIDTNLPLYSLIILIAFLINIIVICYIAYKKDRLDHKLIYLLIFEHIGMILGAKLYSFFSNPAQYNYHFDIFKIGFSSIGAVIGIIIMSFIYIKLFKTSIKEIVEIFICSIPLIYSIGKIACFITGCCCGIEYNGPFSITYLYSSNNHNGISLFPIQLLESIVSFIIFIITFRIVMKDKINKRNVGIITIVIFTSKFLLDFLRFTHMKELISFNQIMCIPFIIIGILLIINKNTLHIQKNNV